MHLKRTKYLYIISFNIYNINNKKYRIVVSKVAIFMEEKGNSSIKNAIDDLLKTSIFKEISKRNNKIFAQKLAVWLVRYILMISSMNESLKIDLEEVLFNLHGEKFRKILEVTEKTFHKMKKDAERYNRYIW